MEIVRETHAEVGYAPSARRRLRRVFSLADAGALLQQGALRLTGILPAAPSRGDLAKALVTAIAYYLGAELAFGVGTFSYLFAPLWPPNMILLCALLQAPYRAWWLYIAAAFPAHIVAETGMGMEAMPLLGAFACNVSLALSAAAGLRRLSAGPPWLDTLARAWSFILVVAVAAPALVAGAVLALGWLTNDAVGGMQFAGRWAVANILGGIVLAPFLVTWIGEGVQWVRQLSLRHALEATLLALALAASAYLGFLVSPAAVPLLAWTPIPLMLWSAVRFGSRGASGAIFIVSLIALRAAIQGRAPIAASSPELAVVSLQMLVAALSAPFLILAAVVLERERAASRSNLAQQELQSILDNTPACVFVKDLEGRYVFANRSGLAALRRDLIGRTTEELFPPNVAAFWSAEDKSIIGNGRTVIREQYVDYGGGDRHYVMNKFPLRDRGGKIYAVCVVATDVTEFRRTQHEVHDLSVRLLSAQDEERRRIARELHDGTVQTLTAVVLNLSRLLKDGSLGENACAIAKESIGLVHEMHAEIRTLSYLLHPPLLDEVGLAPALTLYVDGFRRRSAIDVELHISPEIGRVQAEVEIALFRVVQESLSNVHRHSQSKSAVIRLEPAPGGLGLTIADAGRGMTSGGSSAEGDHLRSLGVGIAGMRARLKQLGGSLDIRSGPGGTIVTAFVPCAQLKDAASSA
jgi:PAS domain S-box-containing protein